jgi:uncharacterized membrane protein
LVCKEREARPSLDGVGWLVDWLNLASLSKVMRRIANKSFEFFFNRVLLISEHRTVNSNWRPNQLSAVYRIFLKGLITLFPIMLTIYLLVWIATKTEQAFGDPLRNFFPQVFGFPGSGFLLGMFLIFAVGLLVNTYVTRRFVDWFESAMNKMPVIKSIYSPIRDVTNLFAHHEGDSQKVVMVQYNDTGIELLGLVTRDTFEDLPKNTVGESSVAVFIPFSYGMGGLTIVVPRSKVRETSLPAERAMQLAITGWIKSSK